MTSAARTPLDREAVAKALHTLDCREADEDYRRQGLTPPENWADPWLPTGIRQLEALRRRADIFLATIARAEGRSS